MDWRTAVVTLFLAFYVNGYSKYGRTCKDIGCLNSQVCVLAEDPCTYGQHSNCGSYPTCKKKSQVEGSHAEPAAPPAPKPTPQSPTRNFDSPPSYPAPEPPSSSHDSPYGNHGSGGHTNPGGLPPYGSNNPYGGNPPHSNNPYGGNPPYGNNPYGGSPPYGNNPYGGSPPNGNNPYGGNPYGGSSNTGGRNPYGGYNPNPSSNTGSGSGGKSPLDSIFNTISNIANGGQGTPGGSGNGQGLSNIFGNLLGNLSKSGGLNSFLNTRPIMENPNYSSYSSNSRSANPQNYPSGSQPGPVQQNKNYGQSYAAHSGANTRKPSYGWNVSFTVILTYLIRQYYYGVIRD